MNTTSFKLLAVAGGSFFLGVCAQAATWSIDVTSGETTERGTIPAGTEAISKTGSGGYVLQSTGANVFHGDATVAGTLRISGNSLDMGGEAIVKNGSGYFQLMNVTIRNPGDLDCRQGAISLIGSCSLGEPGTHGMSFANGTTFQLNMQENAIAWPVTCAGAITFSEASGSSYENRNTITGPVTVAGDVMASVGGRLTFSGDFAMNSGTRFYKTGEGVLRVCGKTTMDGVTTWLQKGLLLYGNGAVVTGHIPSSEYTTSDGSRRPAIKIEEGAKVSYDGTGNGYGTLGYQNYAAFWMTGGQVDVTLSWGWRIGQLGGADLMVGGGVLDVKAGQIVIGNDAANGTKRNPYTLSVSGGSSVVRVNGTISSGADGVVVNVGKGATLSSKKISCSASYPDFTINFDNGIFKPRYYTSAFGTGSQSPRLLVQDGGLVYDTTDVVDGGGAGSYSELYASLEKPTGKVVAEIGLPTVESDPANFTAFSSASYSIPTSVRISGAGTGASAFLEINELTRKPVRIVVTGAGTGYDDDTTVTLDSPDGTRRYVCPVTLKTPSGTGSLVKRGTNSLVLYGVNTYGGATILEAGWTKFSGDSAYPQGSPLTVKRGAYLETQNRTIPYQVRSLSGTGTIRTFDKGVEVTEKIFVDLADLRAGRRMSCETPLMIGKDVVVEVVDSEGLWTPVSADFIKVNGPYAITCASALQTVAEQERWEVRIKDNCLHLKPERKLCIILR